MTTTTVTAPMRPATSGRAPRLRASGLLASERIKLTSLASTWWTIGTAVVLSLGIAALFAATMSIDASAAPVADRAELALRAASVTGSFASLVLAVLGVVAIGSEHASGTIRTTWTAAPTRIPALLAKGAVVGVTAFLTGLLVTFGSFGVAAGFLGDPLDLLLHDGIVGRLVAGAGALAAIALVALAIGAIVRATAGGIAIIMALLFVVPIVLAVLPVGWSADVARLMPSELGLAVYSSGDDGFGPLGALALLGAWVAATWIPALALAAGRDA